MVEFHRIKLTNCNAGTTKRIFLVKNNWFLSWLHSSPKKCQKELSTETEDKK